MSVATASSMPQAHGSPASAAAQLVPTSSWKRALAAGTSRQYARAFSGSSGMAPPSHTSAAPGAVDGARNCLKLTKPVA